MNTRLISRLGYPFPGRMNTHAALIENEVQQWIDDYTCLPAALLNRYKRSCFGHLGPRFYPQAGLDRLIPLSRFFLWVFAHDDFFGPWPQDELHQISREAVAILEGGPVVRDNEIMRQLKVFCEELSPYTTPAWQKRFIKNMADYFSSMEDERLYNHNRIVKYPSLEEYIALRLRTTAMFPVIDLLEIAMDKILPAFVLNHPGIQQLIILTNRFTAWSNDCLSVTREQGIEVTNLVLVIQHERKCSMKEALEAAIAQHDKDIQAFMAILSSLPDFGVWQPVVEAYVQGLEWIIAGHLDWYYTTKRYEETSLDRVI